MRSLADDGVQLLGHVAARRAAALVRGGRLPRDAVPLGDLGHGDERGRGGGPAARRNGGGRRGGYDLIEQGVNGYRVPVEDEGALADALERVAADPDWRDQRRASARAASTAGYTGEAWAAAVRDLVRRLRPARGGAGRPRGPARIALLTEIPRRPASRCSTHSPSATASTGASSSSPNATAPPVPRYEEEFRFAGAPARRPAPSRAARWVVFSRGAGPNSTRSTQTSSLLGGWNQPAFWRRLAWARRRGRPAAVWVESTLRDAAARLRERAQAALARQAAAFVVPGRAAEEYVRVARRAPEARRGRRPERRRRCGSSRPTSGRERLRSEPGSTAVRPLRRPPLAREGRSTSWSRPHAISPPTGAGRAPARTRRELRAAGSRDASGCSATSTRDDLPALVRARRRALPPVALRPWGMSLNEGGRGGAPARGERGRRRGVRPDRGGDNGYRVPVDDAPALAEALTKVAVDPDWRLAPGERSRELTAGYTGDAWAAAVADLVRLFLD